MMGRFRAITVTFALIAIVVPAAHAQADPEQVADRYVTALEGTMAATATVDDLDDLLSLYAADASYEHPRVGIRVETAPEIRGGMTSFLGSTRRPSIRILDQIISPHVAILELEVEFEVNRDGVWEASRRQQVTTLELRDGRITRVIDYW